MGLIKKVVVIPAAGVRLMGNLDVPENAGAMVIFSHGSGSSRFSPRNRQVAEVLHHYGIATLLTDLLTPEEDETSDNRFDMGLLTSRLVEVTRYIFDRTDLHHLPLGYFGASTGAASALRASVILSDIIGAVVCRGGRPDFASSVLPAVKAPVLLLAGSMDEPVLELNREAYKRLTCEKKLMVINGATHLFEEQGKLEEVAQLASGWFVRYLFSPSVNRMAR